MRASILVLAALLAACAAGPDYRAPDTAPAVLEQAAEPYFNRAEFEAQWWTRFGDALLNQLVREALSGNRELHVALARVREARALFDDAGWDRYPALTAGATRSVGESQLPDAGGARVHTEWYRIGLDAAWEIDLFGGVRRGIELAQAQAEAAQADLHAAQVTVIAEVARNYLELRGAELRLTVARQNRDKQAETLRLTEIRHQAGASSELDVAGARARLAAVESTVPVFEAAAQRSRHRLAVLLGGRPAALTARLAAANPVAIAQELPLGDATQLLQRRPDVRAAERRLAAATAGVGLATADLFPRLSVSGFVGFFSGQGGALLESGARAWSLTPALSWPGLDLGSARAQVRAAGARSEAALAAYEQTVLLALEETENALVAYGRGRERLAKLLEQAGASRRAAELARIRYSEGAADFLVLLDADRTLLAAEDAVAEAETAVNTAAVAVYKALGGGWDASPVTAAPAAAG